MQSNSKYTIASEKIDEYRIVHRLALEDSSLSDEGEYKIVAENNVGKSDATASLKLYSKKSFLFPCRLYTFFSYFILFF